ncbi:uncharacterized protein LOC131887571 [Tigriopus californicus]|uniref:uncharacterized protein LOC131887571 n=1 Tax=Tigriopus californicus TaxID=6832 RepID=UPI0027DA7B72|nr:uncharacterized protein LOC131887571 [Tigriopus californicus]
MSHSTPPLGLLCWRVYLLVWMGSLVQGSCVSLSLDSGTREERLQVGKKKYEMLVTDAKMPRYGPCWKKALQALETGCQNLTDDEQSYMALQFANCFLAKAGQTTYPCSRNQVLSECLKDMDHKAFTTFSDFFTHTHNMCYFLQSQVWHEHTEQTIARLSAASAQMSSNLEDSSNLQMNIIQNQRESLEYQRQIVANGTILSQAISSSKENVKEMLQEFKTSTLEQRTMIFEIFERLSNKLQNLVVNEVSWLYSVVFYGSCLLVVYLGTATRRTSDARLLLYCVLSLNFLMDRLVCNLSLQDGSEPVGDIEDLPETIYFRIWLMRKLVVFLCVCLTGYVAVNYVDYNVVNNKILEDIRKQNADLKLNMETIHVANRYSKPPQPKDVLDGNGPLLEDPFTGNFTDPGNWADRSENDDDSNCEDEDDDDDDTMSFNSTQTDQTWFGRSDFHPDLSEVSSCEDDEAGLELGLSLLSNISSHVPDRSPQCIPKAPPRSSQSSRSRSVTPSPSLNETTHSYNLRNRSTMSRKSDLRPEYAFETDMAFGKTITQMANITKRNSAKIKMALKKSKANQSTRGPGFYSSDDNCLDP